MCNYLRVKFSKEKQLNRTLFDYSKKYRLTMNDIIKSPTKMKTFSISATQVPSSKLARQTDFCLIVSSVISDAHRVARTAENEFHQVEEVYRRRREPARETFAKSSLVSRFFHSNLAIVAGLILFVKFLGREFTVALQKYQRGLVNVASQQFRPQQVVNATRYVTKLGVYLGKYLVKIYY